MPASRLFAAAGALLCGIAVALGALASHLATPEARPRLALAAAFAFGHGLAMLLLRSRDGGLALVARSTLLAGVLLFAGSLVFAAFSGGRAMLAPFGGSLLMLGWLLAAIDFLRKD
jgi:uncharacterized membrane protein YgdD (TMEM256/DUF423 family)